MPRKIHMVGSLPPEIANPHGWLLEHAKADELTTLPLDFEQFWIIDYLRSLRTRGDSFRAIQTGDYQGYDDFMIYRPVPGGRVSEADVSLRRKDILAAALDAYDGLPGPKPPVMLCRAHPIDLALFTFVGGPDMRHPVRTLNGARLALAHQRAYELDLVTELGQLEAFTAHHDADGVLQLEEPHVLYALLQAPALARPALAHWLARRTARVLDLMCGAHVILHLCYGRLQGKAAVTPENLTPAVLYLNALALACAKRGIELPDAVGIPAAYGREPTPTGMGFYEPICHLDDAWTGRLIAGVVDAGTTEAGAIGRGEIALSHFEHYAGHEVYAVSLPCGAGDLSEAEASVALSYTRAVAQA